MAASELVFPGDEIAWAEEFLPGDGTYEEDGMIFAARLGNLLLDRQEYEARVVPKTTTPATLKPNDIVIGRVIGLRKSFAIVRVEAKADAPTRPLNLGANATLHVAKVSRDYLERLEDALRLGDVIRAEVLEAKPAVQLSTKDWELGVLLARCPRCRTEMDAKGHGLVCPECDWKTSAKLAVDYGEGLLLPPKDVEDRMQARREEQDDLGFQYRGPPVPRLGDEDRRGGHGGRSGGGGGNRGGGRRGGNKGGGKGGRRGGGNKGGRGGRSNN